MIPAPPHIKPPDGGGFGDLVREALTERITGKRRGGRSFPKRGAACCTVHIVGIYVGARLLDAGGQMGSDITFDKTELSVLLHGIHGEHVCPIDAKDAIFGIGVGRGKEI